MQKEDIINKCLKKAGGTYLEIGVEHGVSMRSVRAQQKWGVDPTIALSQNSFVNAVKKRLACLSGIRYFEMTSDDFFERNDDLLQKSKIGVALIDGAHSYEQSLRDVNHCLKYLHGEGILVMHDCNPSSEVMATSAPSFEEAMEKVPRGSSRAWTGDVWKTIVHLRSFRHDLAICVMDCDYGVGLVKRGKAEAALNLSPEKIRDMTYHDLKTHRKELLNLKAPELIDDVLKEMFSA
ncbi:MAG: class I SAM-dependent methyltransferase [Candidatus Omnitrophica bacterium]|nr:class I SAM-dependent methyltransferase [Candidatus Omnitrophota bacterium]